MGKGVVSEGVQAGGEGDRRGWRGRGQEEGLSPWRPRNWHLTLSLRYAPPNPQHYPMTSRKNSTSMWATQHISLIKGSFLKALVFLVFFFCTTKRELLFFLNWPLCLAECPAHRGFSVNSVGHLEGDHCFMLFAFPVFRWGPRMHKQLHHVGDFKWKQHKVRVFNISGNVGQKKETAGRPDENSTQARNSSS